MCFLRTPLAVSSDYRAWLELYRAAKQSSRAFPGILEYLDEHPRLINYSKQPGSGWTLLHQAAYWNVSRTLFIKFRELGADGSILDAAGLTAADVVPLDAKAINPVREIFNVAKSKVTTADRAASASAISAPIAAGIESFSSVLFLVLFLVFFVCVCACCGFAMLTTLFGL